MMKSIEASSLGRWTFFDHAHPHCVAGKKLALTRSDSFPGGHSVAAAWFPKNLQCASRKDISMLLRGEKRKEKGIWPLKNIPFRCS
jgi:hypothetical protein